MTNLIQTVMGAITPAMMAKMSSLTGESTAAVGKGLTAAVPALFAGALQQGASPTGASSLLGLVSQATSGGNPLDAPAETLAEDSTHEASLTQGKALVSSLLGGSGGGVTNALASFAGIKAGSAANLLALAAPLVLGAIGRAAGASPTAAGLQSLLAGQKANIASALPAGLGSLLGLGGAAAALKQAADPARPEGFGRYIPWVIAALVVLALIFGLRNCSHRMAPVTAPPETPAPAPATPAPAPATPAPAETPAPAPSAMETLTLPGGGTISVAPGSIGYSLVKFLQSDAPAPKTFVFDNLTFATASSDLTADSQGTVDTLIAILKAYPAVNVRIVGYTDNQGAPAANKALSESRAADVAKLLTTGGVASERIETAGMGEANPIADNATEEGRAHNRRTELVVTKK